jgi:hypothetical protein
MKQRDNQEENVNALDNADQPDDSDSNENGNHNIEAVQPEHIERGQLR